MKHPARGFDGGGLGGFWLISQIHEERIYFELLRNLDSPEVPQNAPHLQVLNVDIFYLTRSSHEALGQNQSIFVDLQESAFPNKRFVDFFYKSVKLLGQQQAVVKQRGSNLCNQAKVAVSLNFNSRPYFQVKIVRCRLDYPSVFNR